MNRRILDCMVIQRRLCNFQECPYSSFRMPAKLNQIFQNFRCMRSVSSQSMSAISNKSIDISNPIFWQRVQLYFDWLIDFQHNKWSKANAFIKISEYCSNTLGWVRIACGGNFVASVLAVAHFARSAFGGFHVESAFIYYSSGWGRSLIAENPAWQSLRNVAAFASTMEVTSPESDTRTPST